MSKVRLDRIASLYLFHPLSRAFGARSKPRVPILMYHGIREDTRTGHPYYETNTSPKVFALQMNYLRDNGYQALDLEVAARTLEQGKRLDRAVVITFDDGYRDFYTHAFPMLAEHGFVASVFVVSGLTGEQRICKDNKEFMTWNEIREVHSYGIQIGSHTVNHPELYQLSPSKVEAEIKHSKETIEDWLGARVSSFSYPFAFPEHDREFVKTVRASLEKHGYENGVSTTIGTAGRGHDWFFLPRLPVNSYDDVALYQAKLQGGYDWLHFPQQIYKRFRHSLPRNWWISRRRDAPEQAGP